MDGVEKLKLLSSQMHLEADQDTACPELKEFNKYGFPVSQAVMSDGRRINLLKTVQTSACERNCYYCCFRAGRDIRRETLKPDEMARAFMALYQGKAVEGLFLSSGIVQGGITTQDKLIATAEILRRKYDYRGYLHLKLMPGVERDQVEAAMRLADRVSINLEGANSQRLAQLAPRKLFMEELLQPLQWAEQIRQNSPSDTWNGRWPSTVTQFVVGAVGESDLELLQTTQSLYKQLKLRRAYYMSFSPVQDTPLENLPPSPLERQNHLYAASFLLRDYNFDMEELPFEANGCLPKGVDPKLAWARQALAGQPVELNRASREELLRVPGIGPKGAQRVLDARKKGKLIDLSQLRSLGITPEQVAQFVLLDGKQPAQQIRMF